MLERFSGLARVVEGDVMKTAQLEPELDKAVHLLVQCGPPIDQAQSS